SWPDVDFTNTAEAKYVPSIWAGRKIAFLLDQIRANGESSEMVDEIMALSMEHGIQTPYTSWLVNPENPRWRHVGRGNMPPPMERPMPVRPGLRGGGGGGGMGGGGRDGAERSAGGAAPAPPPGRTR